LESHPIDHRPNNFPQSSALVDAGSSYFDQLMTDPALTSIILGLETNTAELAAVTSLAGSLSALPTGSAGLEEAHSIINQLPPGPSSFFNSLLNAEISIASSVLNNGAVATTGGSGTGAVLSTPTATGTGSSGSSTGSVSQVSKNAAATPGFAKAAGVAVGVFGAAVALL
jgi:hypothetical protein